MEIVAGLQVISIKPKVWDINSPYYLDRLHAVMVSYADFHQSRTRRHDAMKMGLHTSLDIPESVNIYLDNGAIQVFTRRD